MSKYNEIPVKNKIELNKAIIAKQHSYIKVDLNWENEIIDVYYRPNGKPTEKYQSLVGPTLIRGRTKRDLVENLYKILIQKGWKEINVSLFGPTLLLEEKNIKEIQEGSSTKVTEFIEKIGWLWEKKKRYEKLEKDLVKLEEAYKENNEKTRVEKVKDKLGNLLFTYMGLIKEIKIKNNNLSFIEQEEDIIYNELVKSIKKDISDDMKDSSNIGNTISLLNELTLENNLTIATSIDDTIIRYQNKHLEAQ